MKIIVLGGAGVFGSRLVDLLQRDGHDVHIAGRTAAIRVDRQGDLSALWQAQPDVIIDAAGPFHSYGNDPYKLPKGCIARKIHYLDLADDADFCSGISQLDAAAKEAGVFAISGCSSVPAISSAAVAALAPDGQIDAISTAILPGNKAPRGKAVVQSILNQCGQDIRVPYAGTHKNIRSWSAPERFNLGQGIIRKAWVIDVPDHRLFADHFKARSVIFRAGLELPIMNHSLAVLSYIRNKTGLRIPVGPIMQIAKLLAPFGTDRGGMQVNVIHAERNTTWTLIAEGGEGPYIPAIAARALLRNITKIAAGARPALNVVSLNDIENALTDLAVTTHITQEKRMPLFERHLNAAYQTMPAKVQDLHNVHGPTIWRGRGSVTRGQSLWSRIIATLFGFPKATADISVSVAITPVNKGETWVRTFGHQTFQSHLRQDGDKMTERFGPFTFTLGLYVKDNKLHFPVPSGRCGPIPLPKFMLPKSAAYEYEENGKFHFDVALKAPLTGQDMVHYKGWLEAG